MFGVKYETTTDNLSQPFRRVSYHQFNLDEKNDSIEESHFVQHIDKDRFIEMAQEALEQVELEEEQKGVLHELIEELLDRTGAPMMADVIFQQFRSQDVIEQLAEDHYLIQQKTLKRQKSLKQKQQQQEEESLILSPNTLKEQELEEEEEEMMTSQSFSHDSTISYCNTISEYTWRVFRLLLLASLVGLVYHFLCNDAGSSVLLLKLCN